MQKETLRQFDLFSFSHFLLFDWPWSNWARSLLTGSLNSQGMISFMITTGSLDWLGFLNWRHDFSGKHFCDGYCMDTMWYLCGDQNSWFYKPSFKNFLRKFVGMQRSFSAKNYHRPPCVEQKITKLDWRSTMYSVVKLSSYFCV